MHICIISLHFRFCVGDRFFLCDNKILCEYDYEERMVFANLAYNSSNLAQMKSGNNRSNNGPANGPSTAPGPKVSSKSKVFKFIRFVFIIIIGTFLGVQAMQAHLVI